MWIKIVGISDYGEKNNNIFGYFSGVAWTILSKLGYYMYTCIVYVYTKYRYLKCCRLIEISKNVNKNNGEG